MPAFQGTFPSPLEWGTLWSPSSRGFANPPGALQSANASRGSTKPLEQEALKSPFSRSFARLQSLIKHHSFKGLIKFPMKGSCGVPALQGTLQSLLQGPSRDISVSRGFVKHQYFKALWKPPFNRGLCEASLNRGLCKVWVSESVLLSVQCELVYVIVHVSHISVKVWLSVLVLALVSVCVSVSISVSVCQCEWMGKCEC